MAWQFERLRLVTSERREISSVILFTTNAQSMKFVMSRNNRDKRVHESKPISDHIAKSVTTAIGIDSCAKVY